MVPFLAALGPIMQGVGSAIGGGADGDSTATGGKGPVLGNYAKDGGRASSGLDTLQIMMIGGAALFAIVLFKKASK